MHNRNTMHMHNRNTMHMHNVHAYRVHILCSAYQEFIPKRQDS